MNDRGRRSAAFLPRRRAAALLKKYNLCVRRVAAGNYRFWLTVLRLIRAKSPAILQNCRVLLYPLPPKPPGQNCAAPRKRRILMQGRGTFRRHPLGESKKAVRKNCLSGAAASCGSALLSALHAQGPKRGGHIAGGPLVRGSELASPAQRPGRRLACFQRAAAGRALGPVPEAEAVYAPRQSEGACRESITTKANSLSGRKGSFYLQQAEGPRRIRTPAPRRHRRHTRWRCRPSAP